MADPPGNFNLQLESSPTSNNNLNMTTKTNYSLTINDNSTPSTSASTENTSNYNNSNNTSYANKVKNTTLTYPNKDQGLILNGYPEIHLEEYLLALSEKIDPKQIIAASRISNNRINIFLTNKELVHKITTQNRYLKIQDKQVEIRKYATPTKRILISHCSPIIPNNLLEEKLTQLGMRLASPIIFLKIGSKYPQFKEILSFRRQVYIIEDNNIIVPESMDIQLDANNTYRIFLSEDTTKCNICRRNGHTDSQCHQNKDNTTDLNASASTEQSETINTRYQQSSEPQAQSTRIEETNTSANIDQPNTTQPANNQQTFQFTSTQQLLQPNVNRKQKTNSETNRPAKLPDEQPTKQKINQTELTIKTTGNTETNKEETSTDELQEITKKIKELQKKSELLKKQKQTVQTPNQNETNNHSEAPDTEFLTPTSSSTPIKRALNSPGAAEDDNQITKSENKTSTTTKKPKTSTTTENLDPQLKQVKIEMEKNPTKYVLNYSKLKHFLENSTNTKDKQQFATEYTDNIPELANTLQNLYKFLTDPKIKHRFTRIINKLNEKNTSATQDDDLIMEL